MKIFNAYMQVRAMAQQIKITRVLNSLCNQKHRRQRQHFLTYNLLILKILLLYPTFPLVALFRRPSHTRRRISIALKQLGHDLILDVRWRRIVLLLLIVLVESIKEVKVTMKIHIFTLMERRPFVYFEKQSDRPSQSNLQVQPMQSVQVQATCS